MIEKLDKLNKKIAFIGCGNMASAIIGGLIKADWPASSIMASNPTQAKLENLSSEFTIQTTNNNLEAASFADIIVLSVKPQKLAEVCSQLSDEHLENKLIISVAAGFQTQTIIEHLGQTPAIVRCMPNTPALIGVGATGLFATEEVSAEQRLITDKIFKAVGLTSWIEQESQMNVVTAIAGSSPAYFFLMMQSMVEQAVESGLSEAVAFDLISQSALGAAQLAQLAKSTQQKSLQQLRQEVTSPGGTTEAAIKSFQENGFEDKVKQAIVASIERGVELGNIN